MGEYINSYNVTSGETYKFKLYKRLENSAYEYDNKLAIEFYGRPANNGEKRNYRLTKGVNSGIESIYCLFTNLPVDVNIGDRIEFMGKLYLVESIGYYYTESRMINASIFNEEYLIAKMPKGITLG